MTLYIVRHGVAVAKNRWRGRDLARPLTKKGLAQAEVLTTSVDQPVDVVLSSPTIRCVATVLGVAARHGVELRTVAALEVGRPDETLALARALLERDVAGADATAQMICTHGEVIPGLLAGLNLVSRSHSLGTCAKGSVWTIEPVPGGYAGTYRTLSAPRARIGQNPASNRARVPGSRRASSI